MENNIIIVIIVAFVLILGVGHMKKARAKRSTPPVNTEIFLNISDDARRAKMQIALNMILDTPYKEYVTGHIKTIKDGSRTQVYANDMPADFQITHKFIDHSSVEWLASTLVHESRHVEQMYTGGYHNAASEIDANMRQIEALRIIGGSQAEIAWLQQADGLHFDSNNNGVLDKNDNWDY